MPTYVYETTGKSKRRFEVRQSMNDAPLTHDPETREPVRRIITGGYGVIEKGNSKPVPPQSGGGHSCCGGCGCH
jgi:predicted nucleic acid-binding Zn ribbon protein